MNMLNNLILECVMSGEVSDEGLFRVKSERRSKVGETCVTTTISVLCKVPQTMLESVKKYATNGRGMRIIGRLDSIYGGEIGVFVEHIEYKIFPNSIREGKYNFKQD